MITEHVFLMLGLVRRTGFPKKSPIPLSLFFTRERNKGKGSFWFPLALTKQTQGGVQMRDLAKGNMARAAEE